MNFIYRFILLFFSGILAGLEWTIIILHWNNLDFLDAIIISLCSLIGSPMAIIAINLKDKKEKKK